MSSDTNSILATAKELIEGDRAKAYGSFGDNAEQQAALWNAYLTDSKGGIRSITAMDVPAMMILVKLMRLSGNTTHRDSWVDVAGFAGLAEQVHDAKVAPAPEPEPVKSVKKFRGGDRVRVRGGVHIASSGGLGSSHRTGSGFSGRVSHYSAIRTMDWVAGDLHSSRIKSAVLYVDPDGGGKRIAVPETWVNPA